MKTYISLFMVCIYQVQQHSSLCEHSVKALFILVWYPYWKSTAPIMYVMYITDIYNSRFFPNYLSNHFATMIIGESCD